MRTALLALLIFVTLAIPGAAHAQVPLSLPRAPAYPYHASSPGPQSLPGPNAVGRGTRGFTPDAALLGQLGYGYGNSGYGSLSQRDIAYVRFMARQQRIEIENAHWHMKDLTPTRNYRLGLPNFYP